MSRETVEVVRSALDAFNRADFPAIAELCDEDLEFVSMLMALEETSYRGRDTWERYWADMHETWEEWQIHDLEVLDAGNECAVALMRMVGKGKASGVPVDQRIGIVYRLREGRLWRVHSYLDPADALEAAGIPT